MLFAELATYYRRLEETPKRNEMVAILAELFGGVGAEEVAPTTYLLQGRLAPFFVPLELGMGENYVADAIARAYGADRAAVIERFDRFGDIGAAAHEMAEEAGRAPVPLSTDGPDAGAADVDVPGEDAAPGAASPTARTGDALDAPSGSATADTGAPSAPDASADTPTSDADAADASAPGVTALRGGGLSGRPDALAAAPDAPAPPTGDPTDHPAGAAPSTSGDAPGVTAVFAELTRIAREAGPGSVERKVAGLAALLGRLDPLSALYLCRIPVGRLRLGIGDPTILDGYSFAHAGDKSLRKRLERAYNETSDLGLLGRTLWAGGMDAVDALTIRVGNPVRPALAERLPSAVAILEKLGRAAVEPKYDGFRCQVHKQGDEVRIYSRNLEDMTGMFPEIAEGTLEQVRAETAIFEGEALAYNPLSDEYLPFQETSKRRRKHGIADAAQELPLRLFAFDALYADGENLSPLPYLERRERLRALLGPGERIALSEEHVAETPEALLAVFEDAIQGGLEGVMAKKLDAPYQAGGRNFNWVKLKRAQAGELTDTVDCVVIGYIYGRGKRSAFGVGALLVGVYDPERDVFPSITKIGTGLSDAEWREVRERCAPHVSPGKPPRVESLLVPSVWVEPAVVIEVLADEITRSPVHTTGMNGEKQGYALRFPRLVSFRDDDKRPEDATTVREIVTMYGQQGAKPVPA